MQVLRACVRVRVRVCGCRADGIINDEDEDKEDDHYDDDHHA